MRQFFNLPSVTYRADEEAISVTDCSSPDMLSDFDI